MEKKKQMTLYENIKRYRMQRNMTQDELAIEVGYSSRSMISRVERGDVDLSESKVNDFARVLRVTPQTLMGWDSETNAGTENALIEIMQYEARKLTKEQQGLIIQMIKQMQKQD